MKAILTTENIDTVVENLRGKTKSSSFSYIVIPKTVRGGIDYKKYKGRGRPRSDDYVRVDTIKMLKGLQKHKI